MLYLSNFIQIDLNDPYIWICALCFSIYSIAPPDPFPKWLSLTVINSCNLRCKMCGQWGIEGYMKGEGREEVELPEPVIPSYPGRSGWRSI
jgi:hypothetical protein